MNSKHKPTLLRGFIPLVEANDNGTELAPVTGKALCLPAEERRRHTLVVGANGSGKSTRVMLPYMFSDIDDPDRSLVIVDAQLALTQPVVDYARRVRGPRARVRYFNPLDPEHSIYWNPIAGIRDRASALDMASSIAAGVPTGAQETQYFRIQATNQIANLIRATNQLGCGTLGEIQRIVEGGASRIREIGERANLPELVSFGAEADRNNNHQTTIAEMLNLLAAWYDDRIALVTSASELDFDELERHATILIIALPEEAVARLRPLTNCLLHRLFEWIMRRGQQRGGALRRPLALHIDEFASAVGAIRDFPLRANTLRKRGLMITAAVQTLSQLQEVYPESSRSLLAAFNHQIFIPRLAAEDAQYVSSLSGLTTTVETVTGAHGETQSSQPLTRPVLLPTEVDRPPKHPKFGPRMTFLLADTPPFQGYLPAVYEDPALADLVAPGRAFRPPCRRRSRKPPGGDTGAAPSAVSPTPPPQPPPLPGISIGTEHWSASRVQAKLDQTLVAIEWPNTTGSARKWWEAFVTENSTRLPLVLRLAEELAVRNTTITDFFLAYVYSNTDNIQANLHYLDYTRVKKEEEARRRAAAEANRESDDTDPADPDSLDRL
jgi:hypothetical protein